MHKMIIAFIRREKLEEISAELRKERICFTYSDVKGFGKEVRLYSKDIHDRIKMEFIADEKDVERIKKIILSNVPHGVSGCGILAINSLEEFIDFSEID